MAWDTELVTLLRVMVDDLEDPPRTEDERLETLLLASAQLLKTQLTFDVTYVVDLDASTLTPDPTTSSPRDDPYINLVCLQAACMTDRNSAGRAARKAISFRDGGSAVDNTARARAYLSLLDKGGWCAVFAEAKLEFIRNETVDGGIAYCVMGPFRVYANASYPDYCPPCDY